MSDLIERLTHHERLLGQYLEDGAMWVEADEEELGYLMRYMDQWKLLMGQAINALTRPSEGERERLADALDQFAVLHDQSPASLREIEFPGTTFTAAAAALRQPAPPTWTRVEDGLPVSGEGSTDEFWVMGKAGQAAAALWTDDGWECMQGALPIEWVDYYQPIVPPGGEV